MRPFPSVVSLSASCAPALSLATLDGLPKWVRRPRFDVTRLQPGLLHLGCGAFHRAHQAVFTQRAVEAQGGAQPAPWGIVAASLVRPGTRDALRPQNGLYSVFEREVDNMRAEVIGTLREVVFAGDDPAGLLARFRDPAIRIVTLTVTASGYCLDSATGRLHAGHPDIQRDIHAPVPRSAIGMLVGGLAQVRQAGVRPPVVMSCDNLASNGAVLRQAAMDYAAMQDDALADWIGRSVQFPCSMVDRIVPGAAPFDSIDVAATLGVFDAAPVATEPFRQWVIEAFDGPRPQWEAAGAELVPDVAPWAASKLRLLNGTHMAVAYLGALAGLRTVSDVTQDPVFAAYSWDLCHYGLPHDIDIWSASFVDRFAAFAAAAAQVVAAESDAVPFYCPVNEISYWAWAGGDFGQMFPFGTGRGPELKRQLARAAIAAITAVRSIDPRARFVQAEPLINVVGVAGNPTDVEAAEAHRQSQYEVFDMIAGRLAPELGGTEDHLDIIGLNFYFNNQWHREGPTIPFGDAAYRPLRWMLAEVAARYRRPMLLTETGVEGNNGAGWLHYVCGEVTAVRRAGVRVEGICIYPIMDYPAWDNMRHCRCGLIRAEDGWNRRILDDELKAQLQMEQWLLSWAEA